MKQILGRLRPRTATEKKLIEKLAYVQGHIERVERWTWTHAEVAGYVGPLIMQKKMIEQLIEDIRSSE